MEQHCIYLRKSRSDADAEARGEGETLARHEKALLELAHRQNLNITQIYREVVSGETIAARPVMQKLLQEVEHGIWAGVLVMEVERLARGDTMDQGFVAQAFKYSDTQIITPTKNYDPNNEFDEEYFEFGLFMSRREYKVINRRLQRGRIASVKEGKYLGSTPPYGYLRKKLEREKGYTLEPHPDQADVVRLIFDLYTNGEKQEDGSSMRLGVHRITYKLNSLKIPPQKGNAWSSASIRDILINPVYIGKIRWNWRSEVKKMADGAMTKARPRTAPEDCILVDGLHEGLVAPEVFDKAQMYMKENPTRPTPTRYLTKNPLGGLIVCGKCGRKMSRRPHYGKEYNDTLMCPLPGCGNVSSALHYVEKATLDNLAEWIEEYKLQWGYDAKEKKTSLTEIKKKALKKLEAEKNTLEKQLANVHDLLEQGVYDTETFLERTRELGARIAQVKADYVDAEKNLHIEETREESFSTIIPKVEHLLDVYHDLPTAKAKNDMLKEVLEKAIYIKETNGRWHGAPDDFELELCPRLPAQKI